MTAVVAGRPGRVLARRRPRATDVAAVTTFVVLLAGRFDVARLNPSAAIDPAFSLRYWLAGLLAIMTLAVRLNNRTAVRGRFQLVLWSLYGISGVLAMSALWGSLNRIGAAGVLDVLLVPLLVGCCAHLAWTRGYRFLHTFLIVPLPVAAAYLLGGLAGVGRTDPGRLSAFYGGPNVFARIMIMGVIAAAYLSVITQRTRWMCAIPPLLAGAALSGSRGGLIGLVLVLPGMGVALRRYIPRGRAKKVALVLGVVGACCALGLAYSRGDFIEERFVRLTVEDRYISGRGNLYGTARDQFAEHPFTGAGLGAFADAYAPDGATYPHNFLLEVAATGGIGALALALTSIGVGLSSARRARRSPLRAQATFCLLMAGYQFVVSQFSGGFFDTRFYWVYLALGCLAAEQRQPAGRS
jgi:O-antigen ligase